MKFLANITSLILLTLYVNSVTANSDFKECEKAIEKRGSKDIVENCLLLEKSTQKAKLYVITAEIFQHITYERINEIFDYGEANSLFKKFANKKKLYSNIEKYYIKEAFNKLNKHSNSDISFINLLFAKIAYITTVYIQSGEKNAEYFKTLELERKFKVNIYQPNLEKYLLKNPNDKEVLYLLGMQGIRVTFPPNPKSMLLYSKIVNKELFLYLKKSAALDSFKAKVALITVSNWEKYTSELSKAANSDDKEALYKIGMLNYNNYIDSNFKNKNLLDKAIIDFEKAQVLGHKGALRNLLPIYYREKPSKKRYTELLKKSVSKFEDGFLSLGNLYWCNGDKAKAKEMYIKAKNKGGINFSEANYALEDLTKLDEPYDGCRFK